MGQGGAARGGVKKKNLKRGRSHAREKAKGVATRKRKGGKARDSINCFRLCLENSDSVKKIVMQQNYVCNV